MLLSVMAALAVSQAPAPWMTQESHPEDLEVWLVTFGPGNDVPEWWGHTALVVQDKRLNHARLYNYGMFSFEKGFFEFAKGFAKGRLDFWVGEDSVEGTFRLYQWLDRDIRVQELNLTPEQAMVVAQTLGTNVLPQNRVYRYLHYDDNCSSRPRDIIDRAVGGQITEASKAPARMTLRQLALRYAMVNPPMSWALDVLQNDAIDKPITQREAAFLPDELERQFAAMTVTRADGTKVPLVRRQWNRYLAKSRAPIPEQAPNWNGQLALMGLAAGAGLFFLSRAGLSGRRGARVGLGVVLTLCGLVLGVLGFAISFMGVWSEHAVCPRNENQFFLSPLTLGLVPLGVMVLRNSPRAARFGRWLTLTLAALGWLGAVVKVLPAFDQANLNVLAVMLPLLVGLSVGFGRATRATATP